jgi:hypothetical protein
MSDVQHTFTDLEDGTTAETVGVRVTVVQGAPPLDGAPGADGVGVPVGGTTAQALVKASNADYDTHWVDAAAGTGAVDSVNGHTGVVVLGASDVGAQPVDTDLTAIAALSTTTFGRALLALADAAALRTAAGLGTAATQASTAFDAAGAAASAQAASQPLDSDLTAIAALATTSFGRSLLTAADAAAARTLTGAGTSNLAIGTTSSTAKAGDYQPTSANISDASTIGKTILTAATAAAVRTAIGLATVAATGAYADLSGLPTLGTAAAANTGTTSGTVPLLSTGGLLPIARIASGTPDGTKFVRDDGTLVTPAGGGGSTLRNVDNPSDALWSGTPTGTDLEFETDVTAGSTLPSGWTWVNQGTTTYEQTGGAAILKPPTSGTTEFPRMIVLAIPTATTWTMTMKIGGFQDVSNWIRQGLVLRRASSGHYTMMSQGAAAFQVNDWTATGTFAGSENASAGNSYMQNFYMRVTKNADGTFTFMKSPDCLSWNAVAGWVSRAAYDTYDQVGLAVNAFASGIQQFAFHWVRFR